MIERKQSVTIPSRGSLGLADDTRMRTIYAPAPSSCLLKTVAEAVGGKSGCMTLYGVAGD